MATQKPHVLVAGAGITGLLIAQGLKKNGIPCTVFEREPSASHYRSREWGMSIQWGLPLLKDCLPEDLFKRVPSAAVDPFYEPENPGILPILDGKTGELLKNVPLVFMYRVSRRRFRALCSEGIDIEYGKAIQGVEYRDDSSVTAIFQDGTEVTGTLLIGADGAQSVVRHHIFGPEKGQVQNVPFTAINLHATYADAEKALFVRKIHPIMRMGIHPDSYWLWLSIQDVPNPDDPATWRFQVMVSYPKDKLETPVTLDKLKEVATEFGEPFRSAFLWVPEDTQIFENGLSYWMPTPWDNKGGRITLAGDAGHPMTFQRGQGMNHGIADASKITRCLKAAVAGEITWAQAVNDYQSDMIDRAGDEVKMSKKNTEMLHDWEQMMNSPIMQKEAAYARDKYQS